METIDIELTEAEFIWLNKTISGICIADVQTGDVLTAASAAKKLRALAKGLEKANKTNFDKTAAGWQVDENWQVVET